MIPAEGLPGPDRQARAGARSKSRFSSVTRTVISLAPGGDEEGAPQEGSAVLAASPAADNFRKLRLVCAADMLPLSQWNSDLPTRISCVSNRLRATHLFPIVLEQPEVAWLGREQPRPYASPSSRFRLP